MNRANKTLSWALATSMMFNLFLAGFLLARLTQPSAPPTVPWAHEGRMNRNQNGPARPLRKLMRKHRGQLMPARAQIHAARDEVRAALLNEPFSEPALTTALAGLRQATGQAQQSLHQILAAGIADLPLEKRRALSESRGLFHMGGPRHHGKRAGRGKYRRNPDDSSSPHKPVPKKPDESQ